jgi:hypothetical protein
VLPAFFLVLSIVFLGMIFKDVFLWYILTEVFFSLPPGFPLFLPLVLLADSIALLPSSLTAYSFGHWHFAVVS